MNLLNSAGFISEINQPTRSDGCLDHLMLKSVQKIMNKQISVNFELVEHNITDHAAILLTTEHRLALDDTGSSGSMYFLNNCRSRNIKK